MEIKLLELIKYPETGAVSELPKGWEDWKFNRTEVWGNSPALQALEDIKEYNKRILGWISYKPDECAGRAGWFCRRLGKRVGADYYFFWGRHWRV